MKKVLILTASYGSWHNSAANNIAEFYKRKWWETKIVDLIKFINPIFAKLTQKSYKIMSEDIPILWEKFFNLTDKVSLAKIIYYLKDPFTQNKFNKLVEEFNPNVDSEEVSILDDKNKKTKKQILSIERKIADLKEKEQEINFYWITKKDLVSELKNIQDAISLLNNELKILKSKNKLDGDFVNDENGEEFEKIIKKISDIEKISLPVLEKKKKEIETKIETINKFSPTEKKVVDSELIAKVVSEQTGVPVGKMISSEFEVLKNIEEILNNQIIGQNEAVKKISQVIKVSKLNITSDLNKPLGSFIFLGQTGTGKTELAKKLAELIFNRKESFIRINMQELMEGHSISKLIGSPPGYVGFDQGGGLTEKVRNNPYSVVLFDEVEKANPEILNILLQVLDEGKLTDSKGRIVDFNNTIIIMTSNIGSEFFEDVGSIGFILDDNEDEQKKKKEKKARKEILESLNSYFSPEFLNRIDETIIFNTLTKDNIKDIVKLNIEKQKEFLKNKIILKVTPSAINKITDLSYSDKYGAREVKRVIKREIINKLANYMVDNDNPQPEDFKITFTVDFNKNKDELKYIFDKKEIKRRKNKVANKKEKKDKVLKKDKEEKDNKKKVKKTIKKKILINSKKIAKVVKE